MGACGVDGMEFLVGFRMVCAAWVVFETSLPHANYLGGYKAWQSCAKASHSDFLTYARGMLPKSISVYNARSQIPNQRPLPLSNFEDMCSQSRQSHMQINLHAHTQNPKISHPSIYAKTPELVANDR